MLTSQVKKDIINRLTISNQSNVSESFDIIPLKLPLNSDVNQFVLFLKPELLRIQDGVNTEAILDILHAKISDWEIEVHGIRYFNYKKINELSLIDKNYSILSKVSRKGKSVLTKTIRDCMESFLEDELKMPYVNIYGGDEFLSLNEFQHLTPSSLQEKVDAAYTRKFGSGIYGTFLPFCRCLILNGFFPRQREWLSHDGSCLLSLCCSSKRNWSQIRAKMVGSIFPDRSHPDSFRGSMFKLMDSLAIKEVSVLKNGIHVSPGPLEAIKQIEIFFSKDDYSAEETLKQTSFGRLMLQAGFSVLDIRNLFKNPLITDVDQLVPILDKTEDLDSWDAITILHSIKHY